MPSHYYHSRPDHELGTTVGHLRYQAKVAAGWKNSHGCKDLTPKLEVHGTLAELAYARALKLPWDGTLLQTRIDTDLYGAEVRSGTQHHYRLLLRLGQVKVRVPYLHATSVNGWHWVLHGWAFARDVQLQKYLDDPGDTKGVRPKAWFFPNDELRPLHTFVPNLCPLMD